MAGFNRLDDWLRERAGDDPVIGAAAVVIDTIARTADEVARAVARGPLNEGLEDKPLAEVYAALDARARELFLNALADLPVPVARVARESGPVVEGRPGAPVAVALDALNGSSNIDANTSPGTLFSIWPEKGEDTFRGPGTEMIAAGLIIYGPRTGMAFTAGEGLRIATRDPDDGTFYVTAEARTLPEDYAREYAVNASNYRFWDFAIRTYVDDMIDGADGPREQDYNMRWSASLVAETVRIINRGGIFLYPADSRPGFGAGRMKLLFHAHPVAYIIEQAGGMATDGKARILEKACGDDLHRRTPLIFGSTPEVERLARYYDLPLGGSRSPLFSRRGLFRM